MADLEMELQEIPKDNLFMALYQQAYRLRQERRQAFSSDEDNPQQLPILGQEANIYYRLGGMTVWELGRTGVEAKRVARGNFGKWIDDHCEFSQKTLDNAMSVYKAFPDERDVTRKFPKKTDLYTVSRIPDEEYRKRISDRVDKMDHLDKKEKKALVSGLAKGEIHPDDPEIQAAIIKSEQRQRAMELRSEETRRHIDAVQEYLEELESEVKRDEKFGEKKPPKTQGRIKAINDGGTAG